MSWYEKDGELWYRDDSEAEISFGEMLVLASLWCIAGFYLPLAMLIWWLV